MQDKTFGLKNKKGKKNQQFVKQVEASVQNKFKNSKVNWRAIFLRFSCIYLFKNSFAQIPYVIKLNIFTRLLNYYSPCYHCNWKYTIFLHFLHSVLQRSFPHFLFLNPPPTPPHIFLNVYNYMCKYFDTSICVRMDVFKIIFIAKTGKWKEGSFKQMQVFISCFSFHGHPTLLKSWSFRSDFFFSYLVYHSLLFSLRKRRKPMKKLWWTLCSNLCGQNWNLRHQRPTKTRNQKSPRRLIFTRITENVHTTLPYFYFLHTTYYFTFCFLVLCLASQILLQNSFLSLPHR